MYCKLSNLTISDGLRKSLTKQQVVAFALLFYLTNNLVLEAALTNL